MTDLEARIDRLESLAAIGQLPIRYALAVDGRDLDSWVGLFVPEVDCGRAGNGREALRAWIEPLLRDFYRSIHQICGHQIDMDGADHAHGVVYCRAEHEVGDKWVVMAIAYFDQYERRDGQWFFVRRRETHWYAADWEERPAAPFMGWPGNEMPPSLPQQFDSWQPFWAQTDRKDLVKLTGQPSPD